MVAECFFGDQQRLHSLQGVFAPQRMFWQVVLPFPWIVLGKGPGGGICDEFQGLLSIASHSLSWANIFLCAGAV